MSSPEQSELQRLERLVEEGQRAVRQAKQDAEAAKQNAEAAERRAYEERQLRLQVEGRSQRTTLYELVQACYEYLHKPLRIKTRISWTTKGVTNPARKYYPKTLKAWEDYSEV